MSDVPLTVPRCRSRSSFRSSDEKQQLEWWQTGWLGDVFRRSNRSSDDIVSEESPARGRTLVPRSTVTETTPVSKSFAIGFSFSPAGLLLPYHSGVAEVLKDFQVIRPDVPIAGASAGALACATVVADVDLPSLLRTLLAVQAALRRCGAPRNLQRVITSHLEELMPQHVAKMFNERPAPASIAFTRVWPPKGFVVNTFTDKKDVQECLEASCNIPFYFAKWPTVQCRGAPCVDGYFASPRSAFGCPPTGADRDIRVLPFTPKQVNAHFKDGDHISPDLQKFDTLLNEKTNGLFEKQVNYYFEKRPLPQLSVMQRLASKSSFTDRSSKHWTFLHGDWAATSSQPTRMLHTYFTGDQSSPPYDDQSSPYDETQSDDALDKLPTFPVQDDESSKTSLEQAHTQPTPKREGSPPTSSTSQPAEDKKWLKQIKWTRRQLLELALHAAPTDIEVLELFDLGRCDALRWIALESQLPSCVQQRRRQIFGSLETS